jgi:hypothetical protein
MTWLLIIFKLLIYLLGLLCALSMNFIYYQFKKIIIEKKYSTMEKNLKKYNLFLYSNEEKVFDLKKLNDENRKLEYLMITIPLVAVVIRTIYYGHFHEGYGFYVLNWQIVLMICCYLYLEIKYRIQFFKFTILMKRLNLEEFLSATPHLKLDEKMAKRLVMAHKKLFYKLQK